MYLYQILTRQSISLHPVIGISALADPDEGARPATLQLWDSRQIANEALSDVIS